MVNNKYNNMYNPFISIEIKYFKFFLLNLPNNYLLLFFFQSMDSYYFYSTYTICHTPTVWTYKCITLCVH